MTAHRHCWHAAYAGQGLWISVCCHCGAWWIPADYVALHPVNHGAHGFGDWPSERRLSDDDVLRLFDAVPAPRGVRADPPHEVMQ